MNFERFNNCVSPLSLQLSYTAFEQWIKKDIKVRECCVFIKKSDGELEPM